MTDPDDYRTATEVAARLRVKQSTLRSWRQNGIGPKSVKFGKRTVYKRAWVEAYEREQEATSARGGEVA